ncbi:MAG TPA: sugar ABC transporter permease [Longimicrobiales bacterium]|nr:sugar ABC transporter permease [Trueperaceae bacterium]HKJ93902.1 sugar ABC transporter permease [Longimicrobiales bacterium]
MDVTAAATRRRGLRIGLGTARNWFILPAALWTLAFTLYPLIHALILSFQRARLGQRETFVGLGNYAADFHDAQFWSALSFTAVLVVVTVAAALALGLGLAMLVSQRLIGRNFFRMLFMIPLFATPVGIGYLAVILFAQSGPINGLLQGLQGLLGAVGLHTSLAVNWGSSPHGAAVAVVMLEIWRWTPFAFLVLLAGMQGIPEEVYEAASLETNRGWDVFRFITLPLLRPMIALALLLITVEAFKTIDIPFAFTKGGPGIATQTYTMLVWRVAFNSFALGSAASLGFLLLVLVLIVVNVLLFVGKLRISIFGED